MVGPARQCIPGQETTDMSTEVGNTPRETLALFEGKQTITLEEAVALIQDQAKRIDELEGRVEALEGEGEAWEEAAAHLEETAEALRQGKLAGESGAEILRRLNSFDATNKTDGRALRVYYSIVKKEKVGVPVKTTEVVRWLRITDMGNPNQTAIRVMERLAELTQEGHLIGEVDCVIHRGRKVVIMQGADGQ